MLKANFAVIRITEKTVVPTVVYLHAGRLIGRSSVCDRRVLLLDSVPLKNVEAKPKETLD
jgi:hypothetical protein